MQWTKIFKIFEFLQDGDGAFSSTRLLFLVWGLGTFHVWSSNSLHLHAMQSIDPTVLGMMGVLMGGKLMQTHQENGGSLPVPAAPPGNTTTTTGV